ncbi:Scr1 family TA system antitoxin-like transcriptional regulator [Tsukamurella paurometabola]
MTAEEAERLWVLQSKQSAAWRTAGAASASADAVPKSLAGVYEVEAGIVELLMQMAKDSRQQGWWHAFGDIPYSVYIGLETDAGVAGASTTRSSGPSQTRAYAEAVPGGSPETTAGRGVEAAAAAPEPDHRRHQRGACGLCSTRRPCTGWSAAVRDGAQQLEHVMELSQLPHITVQVLPFEVGAHAGINGQLRPGVRRRGRLERGVHRDDCTWRTCTTCRSTR